MLQQKFKEIDKKKWVEYVTINNNQKKKWKNWLSWMVFIGMLEDFTIQNYIGTDPEITIHLKACG